MLLCILFGGRETVESFNIELYLLTKLLRGLLFLSEPSLTPLRGSNTPWLTDCYAHLGVFLQVCCVEAVVFSFVDVML